MGRIRLRANWVKELTDSDSRNAKTVVDEKWKTVVKPVIVDQCATYTASAECTKDTANKCAWAAGACSKNVDAAEKQCLDLTASDKCVADKTCGWKAGACSKLTGCAALLTDATCKADTTCEFKNSKCSLTPPPLCNTFKADDVCTARTDCAWADTKCSNKIQGCQVYTQRATCHSPMEAIKQGDTETYNKCTWTKFSCGTKLVKAPAVIPCGFSGTKAACDKDAKCLW